MKKNKTKGLFASIVLGVAVTACAPASSSGTGDSSGPTGHTVRQYQVTSGIALRFDPLNFISCR